MDSNQLVNQVKEDNIVFISLQFTDIQGTVKSVSIPINHLEEALERGIWFDGSSIEGFARIHEADMFLKPDPATYAVLPWSSPERRRARIICDVYGTDGRPFKGDPRSVLKNSVAKARELGLNFSCGPEVEFFLFKNEPGSIEPVLHDVAGYFDFSPRDKAQIVRSDIVRALVDLGIDVEASHHEVAAGQHEIDFEYADAVTAADNVMTFKYTVKAVAATHGLLATFMPKPVVGISGSGMHTHQSIQGKDGKNLFFDPEGQFKLSDMAHYFVGGQLAHAKAISAVAAPTVNSYKRLVPGYEAPVYICWAQINRSALIRIPRYSVGREESTRVELRCPDPSCNPYLAFTVMLEAGLDGIQNKIAPPPPVSDDVYEYSLADLEDRGIGMLPGTLNDALEELAADDVVRGALGEHVYEVFHRARLAEWDEYRLQVSQWERDRYLEIS
ncbi:MAG TPA: glutamine synthetase family protein [candidate division Zixibacteria bacterium]|nr:glutamine synthetase family protein [candidate division Zixibacteria bacterium]